MKKLAIFGATGSIGVQTLKAIELYPERFSVFALTANKNYKLLLELCKKYKPQYVALADGNASKEFKKNIPKGIKLIEGDDCLEIIAALDGYDTAVMAQVGISGLLPTVCAIKSGKKIALANKEVLVTAGSIIKKLLKDNNSEIFPIDSEHSAIWQSLRAGNKNEVSSIVLTASGGPFYGYKKNQLDAVTASDALKHPTWNMGKKITIDSATLMNKGFEIAEASFLFDLPENKIKVTVHRESIIHSMVNFVDGNTVAALAKPDMSVPILYALSYPERLKGYTDNLEFDKIQKLTFLSVDSENFPCIEICREGLRKGKSALAAINAANEIAVDSFLNQKIKFTDIPKKISDSFKNFSDIHLNTAEEVLSLDKEVRKFALSLI